MTEQQYVSLVAQGGTPVRLVNQRGAPYPTTGSGAIVFANGPDITNPTITNPAWIGPFDIEGLTVSDFLKITGSFIGNSRAYTGTGNISLLTTDYEIILAKTIPAATTVTLPAAPESGRLVRVSDGIGNAETYNITIQGAGGTLINGAANFVLSSNYASVELRFSDGGWNIVDQYFGEPIPLVSSWSGGTTGLTPATATTGAVVLGGALSVSNGGTGATTTQAASQNLSTAFTVADLAGLKGLTSRPESVLVKTGQAAGIWKWVSGSTATPNDGTVVQCTSGPSGRYERIFSGPIYVTWFGAVGDNVTDDAAAINATIAYANAQTFPTQIYFPPGFYQSYSALTPITGPTRLIAGGPRSAVIIFSGNFDCVSFIGSAGTGRVADAGISNLGIYADGMTGGNAIVVDFAQDMRFDDLLIYNAFNGISIRQAGNTQIANLDMQPLRGIYGIKAYGSNTTRNGANDQTDVIGLTNCTIQNALVASVSNSTADLIWLDGYAHTLDLVSIRLLCGKRAIYTSNTPGVAQAYRPSFITGFNVQIENAYEQGIYFAYVSDVTLDGMFLVGSQSQSGCFASTDANLLKFSNCRVSGNYFHGFELDGSEDVALSNCMVFNNSQVGNGLKSGVYMNNVTNFAMAGGLAGKAVGVPTYTENQRFGIEINGTSQAVALGVCMTGNVDAAFSGDLSVIENSVTAGALLKATSAIGFSGRSRVRSGADGELTLLNSAETNFTVLQFGGTGSSDPAVRRTGATLEAVAADQSAWIPLKVSYLKATAIIVSSLPSASAAGAGARHVVTDANATIFGSIVVGGGVNTVPVFSDGVDWRIG